MEDFFKPHRFLRCDAEGKDFGFSLPRDEGGCAECQQKLKLCMYVSEQSLMQIIEKERLRLSCPWRTNDVTECVAQDNFLQSNIVKNFGYICLSAKWDSPKMWGLYAERSRGACLIFEFDVIKLNEETYELLEDGMSALNDRLLIRKVRYSDTRSKSGDADILYRKSSTWSDEFEYRILFDLSAGFKGEIETCNTPNGVRVDYYYSELLRDLRTIVLGPSCRYNEVEIRSVIENKTRDLKRVKCCELDSISYETQLLPDIHSCMVDRADFSPDKFEYRVNDECLFKKVERMLQLNEVYAPLKAWTVFCSSFIEKVIRGIGGRVEKCYRNSYFVGFKGVCEYLLVKVRFMDINEEKILLLEYDETSYSVKMEYRFSQMKLNLMYKFAAGEITFDEMKADSDIEIPNEVISAMKKIHDIAHEWEKSRIGNT